MNDLTNIARAETIALSLAAAFLYALTSVLQHSAAATVAPTPSLRPSLILALLRRPRWLAGNLAEIVAYGLEFLALRRGALLLNETVLVTGLLFALPMGAALSHRRLRREDWYGAVAVVVGLSMLLAVGLPTRGRGQATGVAWAISLGLGGAVVVALIITAPSEHGRTRALQLGAACGVLFGVNAALTKASGHVLDRGIVHALTAWQPYVLVGSAVVGFVLAQNAFQAGRLDASLPILTISRPVVAGMIGVLAFHEKMASSPLAVAIELAAVAAMIFGVVTLAHSPLVVPELDEPPTVGSAA